MFIMLLTIRPKKSMLSKFTKHPFLFSRIEIDMLKGNSDSEEAIVQATPEKWSQCGLRSN